MDAPILATKLFIPPPRPNLVRRPRLLEQLDRGLRTGHRLTLIAAFAGSGKTTLLSEWAAGCEFPLCWLSLDADDNDPARFWTHAIAALQTIHPQIGQSALPMLQSPQPPPTRPILTSLLNELAALPDTSILVLDDYHLITTSDIHRDVAFLLDHLPPQLRLVIATRADPPLPIARLRARGQLSELRADDLRFSAAETAAFLNDIMGLELSADDVNALEARTEGWAAGLHLAALSMQECHDPHAFVNTFTGGQQYILDYLMEEVFSRQPGPVQQFLLRTSFLDRMCGSLCDSVIETREQRPETDQARSPVSGLRSQAVLEHLESSNLFIVPLDTEHHWYRYHHLFGDLLRRRLEQTVSLDQMAQLHRRASRWFEGGGLLDQAVKHARAAGDPERVARIAEKAAGDSLLDARMTTLLRWVDPLPQDVLRAHPRLRIYRAWALYMNGHIEAAQQALGDCRQTLETLPPSPENAALRRTLTRLLDTIDLTALGFMYSVDNKIKDAIRVCSQARDMALEDNQVFLAAQATEGLALAQYHQGRLQASARSCQQVIDLATQGAAQPPLAAAGYVELAGIYMEWNDLEKAADLLDEALALCRQWGIVQTLNEAYTAQSHLFQLRGDIESAWEALEKARQFSSLEGDQSMVNFRLATQQARLNLAAGEPGRAVRWVEGTRAAFASGAGGQQLPAAFVVTLQTTLARAFLAQDRATEALAALEPLLEPAEAAGAFLHVIQASVLKALALHALDDTSAALAALERSLTLAEPAGFVRTYVNEGTPMLALLRKAAAHETSFGYTQTLLSAFKAERSASSAPPLAGTAALVDPLTPRELDVLHLISQGLSNKDIAEQLVIALNTVKRHTSSIYGKLGVRSRTQAIARARELGLLSLTPRSESSA
jgi:LuxR family maltose regulon positive regulatory protein